MPDIQPDAKNSRRRPWQWSIRGMFLLTAIVALLLVLYFGHDRRRSAQAVATFRKLGGNVIYDYQLDGETDFVKFARTVGEDYFGSVVTVRLDRDLTQRQFDKLAHIPSVKTLWLDNLAFAGANWQTLAKLTELEELHLSSCPFDDNDLDALSQLPNLKRLVLNGSMITDHGLEKLAHFKQLKSLSLVRTMITPEGLTKIRAALPHCHIQDVGGYAALGAVLIMPDGKRTNRYQGKFTLSIASRQRSIISNGTSLHPGNLWFTSLLTQDGPVTLTLTLGKQYSGSVQVQVTKGIAQPRFVELPMKEIKASTPEPAQLRSH